MKFWAWLSRNSDQLKALAALTVVIGGLTGIPILFYKWMQPDIVITFTVQNSTMPPALKKWIEEATNNIRELPTLELQTDSYLKTHNLLMKLENPGLFALLLKPQTDPYRSLRDLQRTGPLDSERKSAQWKILEPGRIRIDLVNQTDRVIPNVRLRLDNAYPLWGVYLEAKFLTENEITKWQQSFSFINSGPTVVFPELPPLPPNSSTNIVIFGYVDNANVSAAVSGFSHKIIPTVTVEDKWPISWMRNQLLLWFSIMILLFLIIILFIVLNVKLEQVTWRKAKKYIPYDLACKEALLGRAESAIALLQEAVTAGYDNFQHMRTDNDLESLWEMEAFKELTHQ
jgi:uncharacterized integral membrane protein